MNYSFKTLFVLIASSLFFLSCSTDDTFRDTSDIQAGEVYYVYSIPELQDVMAHIYNKRQQSITRGAIDSLQTAIADGNIIVVFETQGDTLELGDKIFIPSGVKLIGYDSFIRRQSGYDKTLFELGDGASIVGLFIDGNRSAVIEKFWSTAVEIKFSNSWSNPHHIGSVMKDCTIKNGNCGVMYMGWNNSITNCIFQDMGSAGVHFSACYHSKVEDCLFENCCLEADVYEHSEGAILWSNYTEGSTIQNNFIYNCPEFAIGGIDSPDNNSILIQNNRMEKTKGIGGDFGSGNAPYNLTIKDNIITDCIYDYAYYTYGIRFAATTNRLGMANTKVVNNINIEGNIIINGGIALDANNANILNNTVVNFSNDYSAPVSFNLANSSVNGNLFVNGNWNQKGGLRVSCLNTTFSQNRIFYEDRALYISNSTNLTFKDNIISGVRRNMFNQTPQSYKVDFYNNIICRGGYLGNALFVSDGSTIEGNIFLGSNSETEGKYFVSSQSKDITVRNNRYVGKVTNEGSIYNGCVSENNMQIHNPEQLQYTSPLVLKNLVANDDYYIYGIVGLPFFTRLVPTEGFQLPDNITVTYSKEDGSTGEMVAGKWLEEYKYGSLSWTRLRDFVYDKESGYVYIPVTMKNFKIYATGE